MFYYIYIYELCPSVVIWRLFKCVMLLNPPSLIVPTDHILGFVEIIHKHDNVIKWKHFPPYWPFVRGIRRSPVNSPLNSIFGRYRRAPAAPTLIKCEVDDEIQFHNDVIKWTLFHVTGPPGFDVFFDLRLKKTLSKQSRRRLFEAPSRSLWRHCNVSTWSRTFREI